MQGTVPGCPAGIAGAVRPHLPPRQAVDLPLDRTLQEPVPRRVELDLVDPVAVAVVGAEDRDVALGAPAMLERLDASRHRARLVHAVQAPAAAFALQPLAERQGNKSHATCC